MNQKTRNIIIVVIAISVVGTTYALFNAGILFPQNQQNQNEKTIYFAPYINSTHSCYTHASGCSAELNNTEISYVINSTNGSINIVGSIFTEANGFFELSLPSERNYTIEFTVIINTETYTGNTIFDTYPTGANCITTGQLAT